MAKFCPYCMTPANLTTYSEVYGPKCSPDLAIKKVWVCFPCDARVGCHRDSDEALGSLANPELRTLRMKAHKKFDKLWKNGKLKRTEAYQWLMTEMDVMKNECHIGMFNLTQCKTVIGLCDQRKGGLE